MPVVTHPLTVYRRLAAEYDEQPNALISIEQRTALSILPGVSGKIVADVAAGTGRWARICAARKARVLSIDFCREMVDRAPRPAVQADVRRLPLPTEAADLTICAFGLGYAPDGFDELVRITKSGGAILVTDVHPDAIERGWTRSFRIGSEVLRAEHHPYKLADLRRPDLELRELREPRFGPPEREIFERRGHGQRFEEAARHPAIFIALWSKR